MALGHYVRRGPDSDDRKIPLVGLDDAFLQKTDSDDDGTHEITTMVINDGKSKCVFPYQCRKKALMGMSTQSDND